jgi:hypothetical protein
MAHESGKVEVVQGFGGGGVELMLEGFRRDGEVDGPLSQADFLAARQYERGQDGAGTSIPE